MNLPIRPYIGVLLGQGVLEVDGSGRATRYRLKTPAARVLGEEA